MSRSRRHGPAATRPAEAGRFDWESRQATPSEAAGFSRPSTSRAHRIEWLRLATYGASGLAAAVFAAMVGLFLVESLPVWRSEGPLGYLLGARWFYRAGEFGVLPMIYGTAAVSAVALALAAPVGLGAAIFTSELLPSRLRLGVKTVVELLAGVPSVVYGLLGVVLLRDWIFHLLRPFDPLSGDTLLTGGVLLSVMILPTVMTFADDALQGVPGRQRRAARGLGLSRATTVLRVVAPRALPGLAAAVLLGLGRALGETIAVFLVVGRRDNRLPETLLDPGSMLRPVVEPGQTLTTKLGGSETFLAWGEPLHWAAIAGLALVLLAMVTGVTVVSGLLTGKGDDGATSG